MMQLRLGMILVLLVLLVFVVACTAIMDQSSEVEPVQGEAVSLTTAVAEATTISPTTAVSEPTVASPTVAPPPLPDMGPAPEILNEVWVNADEPVTLESQAGKVVLLEFWTFG